MSSLTVVQKYDMQTIIYIILHEYIYCQASNIYLIYIFIYYSGVLLLPRNPAQIKEKSKEYYEILRLLLSVYRILPK